MKLELKYPVFPFFINQEFGDSQACTEDNNLPLIKRKVVGMQWGTKTCPVGYVELYPLLGMKGHTGMDIHATHGQELYHCGPDGVVEEIQTETERGLGIGIVTNDKFEMEGEEYQAKLRYWHLKGFNVKLGDSVKTGDLIGWCDNTGLSAGDHLHFECKPVIKNRSGLYYNVFQDNGYYGSIDPKPYFIGVYASQKNYIVNSNLQFGSKGTEVIKLQDALRLIGYFKHESTGYYGKITQNAVLDFQYENGIVKFGIESLYGFYFGKKSRKCLESLLSTLNTVQ